MNPNQDQNQHPLPTPVQPFTPTTPPPVAPVTPTQLPIGSASPLDQSPIATTPQPGGAPQPTPPSPRMRILSKMQKVQLVFAAILLIVVGYFSLQQMMKDDDLIKNGVKVEATSTGRAFETTERVGKSTRNTVYKAWYEYEHENGYTSRTIGDKTYDTEAEIVAGKKATVYYDPDDAGKGTIVTDEP